MDQASTTALILALLVILVLVIENRRQRSGCPARAAEAPRSAPD